MYFGSLQIDNFMVIQFKILFVKYQAGLQVLQYAVLKSYGKNY